MKQYHYVMVYSDTRSKSVSPNEQYFNDTNRIYDLPELLKAGWRPVREVPFQSAMQGNL